MADDCCSCSVSDDKAANDPRWRRILWIALVSNASMFVVEIVAGTLSGSRSLQADALDFFGDSANYAASLGVAGMALSWRARVALIKGLTIFGFGLAILVWAIWGLIQGSSPEPLTMTGVGTMALIVNVGVAVLLFQYRSGDANMRSVWVCSRNDSINNLLVIGAGIAVLWTGSGYPDQFIALVMAALGIHGGSQVIRQASRELKAATA